MTHLPLKVRFCPSPTGLMHFGNARTALFNYLFARSQGGAFLLRIEDTDKERSQTAFDEALQNDLHWLGLEWDEGPEKGGELGPYYQSERQAIYNDYYHRLILAGDAYFCFCSEAQLSLSRKAQLMAGKPPRYAGTCRSLANDAVEQKLTEGIKPTLRFRVPENTLITFEDIVRGRQAFDSDDIGDFIIRRADGTAPFMFCNAIDDALMQVSHVMRGEDHVTNTPRQIMILRALGLPLPIYCHIALIVGFDGTPLSKRHGSRSIQELREIGYLPEAINNYLARLGHYFETNQLMSLTEMANHFQFAHLSKSPAKFDKQQLDYWQKEAVLHLKIENLWSWLNEEAQKLIPLEKKQLFLETFKPNIALPEDINTWAKICFSKDDLHQPAIATLHATGKDFFTTAVEAFITHQNDSSKLLDHLQKKLNLKGKALYQPLRMALTGRVDGPELAKLLLLIPADIITSRLQGIA